MSSQAISLSRSRFCDILVKVTKRAWLRQVDWDTVVATNALLCEGGSALHKPSSEGYEETKAFWIENYEQEFTLAQAIDICRRCHRMAPFCFYNEILLWPLFAIALLTFAD